MMRHSDLPILEFDDTKTAVINPEDIGIPAFQTDKLVITFFPEALEALKQEGTVVLDRTIPGENPIDVYRFVDSGVVIFRGGVGCPACAGDMDAMHAAGINKVMFCGGGGVLDSSIEVGTPMVIEGAIRDEGFSYHYLEPSRLVYADPGTVAKITDYLTQKEVAHIKGITWTTDCLFRETKELVAARRAEGARMVEMEQAGCLAVAQYRGFSYGALIYGGDDVTKDQWDNRKWRSRKGMRYDLIRLCEELVQII